MTTPGGRLLFALAVLGMACGDDSGGSSAGAGAGGSSTADGAATSTAQGLTSGAGGAGGSFANDPDCPPEVPADLSPCTSQRLTCLYDACDGEWERRQMSCSDEGGGDAASWKDDGCIVLSTCPEVRPAAGEPCKPPEGNLPCAYPESPCFTDVPWSLACVDGTWSEACPARQCRSLVDKTTCRETPGCAWWFEDSEDCGGNADPLTEDGCFQEADCTVHGCADPETTCEETRASSMFDECLASEDVFLCM